MELPRLWVRIVSVLVPGDRRGEWIEEWDGELTARGAPMRHAWGALGDAWYLRREGWTMESMLRDVRLAVKGLARKPFFTALAGITLAIGIGARKADVAEHQVEHGHLQRGGWRSPQRPSLSR